jgi:hypothetical protein
LYDLDHIGNNLYWCDSDRQVVEVFSFATRERKVIIRDFGGNFPTSLAIIPEEG